MKKNELNREMESRLMYIENKDQEIDGSRARIGWVTFSKSGRTVYYKGRSLVRQQGGGIKGNYLEMDSGDEYWISALKNKGSNVHKFDPLTVKVDEDAVALYEKIKGKA